MTAAALRQAEIAARLFADEEQEPSGDRDMDRDSAGRRDIPPLTAANIAHLDTQD